MMRINKDLLILSCLILLLGISSLIFLQRILPLVSHVSYYCQSFVSSLSWSVPYYFGIFPVVLFSIFLLAAIIRFLVIYGKIHISKRALIHKTRVNVSFNALLGKLQLSDKAYLIESQKQFAFCLGIRKPKIYVSTGLVKSLTEQELEAVLRHERYHLNNRDTLIMLIASIGQSLLPFFPLLSDFLNNYRVEREIKADSEAIQGLGDERPLISVLKKLLTTQPVSMAMASSIADQDSLEPRIRAIVKKDFNFKRFRAKHILISVSSIFVMGIITLAPVQAVEVHHMGEDVMMICPNDNECLNACRKQYSSPRKNYNENPSYTPMK